MKRKPRHCQEKKSALGPGWAINIGMFLLSFLLLGPSANAESPAQPNPKPLRSGIETTVSLSRRYAFALRRSEYYPITVAGWLYNNPDLAAVSSTGLSFAVLMGSDNDEKRPLSYLHEAFASLRWPDHEKWHLDIGRQFLVYSFGAATFDGADLSRRFGKHWKLRLLSGTQRLVGIGSMAYQEHMPTHALEAAWSNEAINSQLAIQTIRKNRTTSWTNEAAHLAALQIWRSPQSQTMVQTHLSYDLNHEQWLQQRIALNTQILQRHFISLGWERAAADNHANADNFSLLELFHGKEDLQRMTKSYRALIGSNWDFSLHHDNLLLSQSRGQEWGGRAKFIDMMADYFSEFARYELPQYKANWLQCGLEYKGMDRWRWSPTLGVEAVEKPGDRTEHVYYSELKALYRLSSLWQWSGSGRMETNPDQKYMASVVTSLSYLY